jgi:hypothetical protein
MITFGPLAPFGVETSGVDLSRPLADDEARDLLDELAAHATQPRTNCAFAMALGISWSGTTRRCCIRRR